METFTSSRTGKPMRMPPRKSDEHAKMARAEKEGATIGPAHGSQRRYKTLMILSEREPKV
jgi:hypothetical protein